jgi:hypothetical protein
MPACRGPARSRAAWARGSAPRPRSRSRRRRAGGALALAIVYLAFAGFVGYVLRTHPTAGSCGCAGSKAVPPSLLHLALDAAAAATGLLYLVTAGPSATAWFVALGWGSAPVIAGLALAGWLVVVAGDGGARRLARVGAAGGPACRVPRGPPPRR